MNDLITKVLQWGVDKGITGPNGKGTLKAQAIKMREECLETFDAALHLYYNQSPHYADVEELKDGIGDLFVTGILLAELAGFTSKECLQHAYYVISKRTGNMVGGTFVKDVDDDLGELDFTKACKLGDETCESCQ